MGQGVSKLKIEIAEMKLTIMGESDVILTKILLLRYFFDKVRNVFHKKTYKAKWQLQGEKSYNNSWIKVAVFQERTTISYWHIFRENVPTPTFFHLHNSHLLEKHKNAQKFRVFEANQSLRWIEINLQTHDVEKFPKICFLTFDDKWVKQWNIVLHHNNSSL